jgi:hypothetical protein
VTAASCRRGADRPPWYGELAVVLFLVVAYDRIADLARVHAGAAVHRGRSLLVAERFLRLDVEQRVDAALAPHALMGQGLSLYYDFAHVTVTIGVLVMVYLLAPAAYRRARTALIAVNVAALGVFVLVPVAPPRLLPGAGVADIVAGSGTWGAWEATRGVASHADAYASMPSLHLAWATWVLLAVRSGTSRRLYRSLAGLHLVLTAAVVVVTGNHYVLDVVAGVALALVVWAPTRVWNLAGRNVRRVAGRQRSAGVTRARRQRRRLPGAFGRDVGLRAIVCEPREQEDSEQGSPEPQRT